MDANRFDTLTRLVLTSSRRKTVRLLVGSLLGGLLPLDLLATEAKKHRGKDRRKGDRSPKRRGGATKTERCLGVGERCPKTLKHGKKTVKHTCNRNCCTRYSVVSADGKRHCACREAGQACTANTARHCCSGVCDGAVCAPGMAAGRPGPVGPPGPPGPPPPPVPSPFAGTCTALQDVCQQDYIPNATCNNRHGCFCYSAPTGAKVCATITGECSGCTTDADCATLLDPNWSCVVGGGYCECPGRLCVYRGICSTTP